MLMACFCCSCFRLVLLGWGLTFLTLCPKKILYLNYPLSYPGPHLTCDIAACEVFVYVRRNYPKILGVIGAELAQIFLWWDFVAFCGEKFPWPQRNFSLEYVRGKEGPVELLTRATYFPYFLGQMVLKLRPKFTKRSLFCVMGPIDTA